MQGDQEELTKVANRVSNSIDYKTLTSEYIQYSKNLGQTSNLTVKEFRDWYSLYQHHPPAQITAQDHEKALRDKEAKIIALEAKLDAAYAVLAELTDDNDVESISEAVESVVQRTVVSLIESYAPMSTRPPVPFTSSKYDILYTSVT